MIINNNDDDNDSLFLDGSAKPAPSVGQSASPHHQSADKQCQKWSPVPGGPQNSDHDGQSAQEECAQWSHCSYQQTEMINSCPFHSNVYFLMVYFVPVKRWDLKSLSLDDKT